MDALRKLFRQFGHWLIAVVWGACPFAVGPSVGAATSSASRATQLVIVIGLWAMWTVVLVTTLVRLPSALVALRVGAPGPICVSAACAIAGHSSVVAMTVSTVALLAPFAPGVADRWVQGGAYGHEKRFVLRAPASLLLGPIQVAWLAIAASLSAGPLLLANRMWIAGTIAVVVGAAATTAAVRSFWMLADRWLVVVPAGIVLHDRFALAETVMCPHRSIGSVGAATVGTTAHDFTMGSMGLAIEITMREPLPMIPRTVRGKPAAPVEPGSWLCTPSSPAAFLQALP